MPAYKLTYFDLRGRGEVIRLVFAAAGAEYEDNRVQPADWPALKPTTIFGSLPILEVQGQTLCQSNTISKFLAGRFNLLGANDLEKARIYMIQDCVTDVVESFYKIQQLKDETEKATQRQKYLDETLPTHLENLQKMLIANNGGNGFFVGERLSLADLQFYHYTTQMEGIGATIDWDGKFPKLKALNQKVASQPKIKAWLEKRPNNPY